MNQKPLIIISDYGLDDACALAYLLECAQTRFSRIDVVCVAGNAPQNQSLINAQKLIYEAQKQKLGGERLKKLRLIHTNTIAQQCACLPSVHGVDGMGDLFPVPSKMDAEPYEEWVKDLPGSATVLSLGPCTVALDIVRRIQTPELVIMAGVVNEAPNHMGMEFNEALDPESFSQLVRFPHKIATLDTCREAGMKLVGASFTGNGLFSVLLNRSLELAYARHPDYACIYDLIAALYLVVPEIFTHHIVTDKRGNRLTELNLKQKDFRLEQYLKSIL